MSSIDFVISTFHDGYSILLGLLVFLAAAILAFSIMVAVRVRASVKRRASRIVEQDHRSANPARSLRYSSLQTVAKLIDYTTKHYATTNGENIKVLRQRLIQAGVYDPRAVAYFFIARVGLAAGFALLASVLIPMFGSRGVTFFWTFVVAAALVGYVAPSLYVDKRIAKRKLEHQAGFPDFMDLLVVCADSGLSMEAALERVGSELGDSYPALAANIHMTNLEIRAGRTLTDALQHFAERLGLEEARSFTTLITQSIELGSSITDALRVYSDDMRHKRLSVAEEKAYALPAKLSVPMMVCIFPVLFVVILLPVFVKLHTGHYF
ncbi:MAG TPA: type II secretion system F family protein [Pseudolabrys sp.]|jgi:tight adherence protein C|nr:type II secretion system F family protein [Pseudolabrys sp.]